MVRLVRGAVVAIGLSHDENVVTAAEGVLEDGGGAQVDVGVVTMGLVGGGAIEVPLAQLTDIRNFLVDSLFRKRFNMNDSPSRCPRAPNRSPLSWTSARSRHRSTRLGEKK